jgi:hypothetical protein
MGFSPGEESRSDGVAAQAIEAQPPSGQIQAMERPRGPRAEQHPREKTWLTSKVLRKRRGIPSEEKQTTA